MIKALKATKSVRVSTVNQGTGSAVDANKTADVLGLRHKGVASAIGNNLRAASAQARRVVREKTPLAPVCGREATSRGGAEAETVRCPPLTTMRPMRTSAGEMWIEQTACTCSKMSQNAIE